MDPMADQPRRRHAGATLMRLGWATGALAGLVEGALALRSIGPAIDRFATMLITIGVDALALALVAAAVGMLSRRGTCERAGALAATASVCAVVAGTALALAGASSRVQKATDQPNFLLISIDTLRPDHLSAYGYARDTSPRLAKLAHQAVRFEDATSHSSWTLPAHVSMLTGLDPQAHGVLARNQRIQDYHVTLAEQLSAAGYATAAWVGSFDWGFVGSRYGFAAGFDRFIHYPHAKRFRSARLIRAVDAFTLEHVDRHVGNARAQVDAVINWIAIDRSAPFFAFVHLYDVHSKPVTLPYEAPAPFRDMFCPGRVDTIDFCDEDVCASDRLLEIARGWRRPLDQHEIEIARCLYDGAIAFVDHELGRLFDALEHWALDERTVVIVTSDHGEAFFEHDYPLHSTLHHEITRIPLIIKAPSAIAGKRATGVVQQADLMPTVLELAGLPPAADIQGQSLVPVLTRFDAQHDVDTLAFDDGFGGVLLRSGSQTYIQHVQARALEGKPVAELYDLDSDPGQKHNRFHRAPDEAARLQQRMADLRRNAQELNARLRDGSKPEAVEIGEQARAGLRALGYIEDEAE